MDRAHRDAILGRGQPARSRLESNRVYLRELVRPGPGNENGSWIYVTDFLLACISQGQLSLEGNGGGQIVESPFGISLRERAVQIYNRHAWKTQGRGGQCLSRALRTCPERDPSEFRIAITSVARGGRAGELLYSLETDEISGVFARDAEGVEKRLFHTADFRVRHLDTHPEGNEIALSVLHRDGTENLAVLKPNGSDLKEVTDGDTRDQAPRWDPGPGRRLVYQSSGMGRDPHGHLVRYGPFSIQQLDLDSGQVSCLAQAADFDFLAPRFATDGGLYYIRRPNGAAPREPSPWFALQATVLLPFRILWLIARLVDGLVERRTGSPLLPAKPAGEQTVTTPSSWVLMCRTAAGVEQTVAEGVRSFDFTPDGSVIYCTGFEVYRIPAQGGAAAKVMAVENIDCIAAL
jgi:hypothetical protein